MSVEGSVYVIQLNRELETRRPCSLSHGVPNPLTTIRAARFQLSSVWAWNRFDIFFEMRSDCQRKVFEIG